jgi:plasmid maintenance system antidote protein VapI
MLCMQNIVGRRIQQRLGEMERSAAWLARQLHKHPSTVSHWISGSHQMTIAQLEIIASKLDTTPAWLLGVDELPKTARPRVAVA